MNRLPLPVRARRVATALGLALLVAGCATPPPPRPVEPLLLDAAFGPPPADIPGGDVLEPSAAMRKFVAGLRATAPRGRDLRFVLLDAMHRPDQLLLRYDTSVTRNAAQAFEARAGNCLSLVLLTASLARELGLPVTFQSVIGEDSFTRQESLVFVSGHVNLVLGRRPTASERLLVDTERGLTVDFLPQQQLIGQRTTELPEPTVRAMFMNNRAAEELAAGRTARAYWWAREAVRLDPGYVAALNTLSVVYLLEGRLDAADRTLRQALDRDPRHVSTLTNLQRVAERAGRADEARALAERVAALQPHPPFEQFDLGRAALSAGQAARARELFAAELRRQPFQPEVHYWMAVAQQQLGDAQRAAAHLGKAVEYSSTQAAHDLYAAKLDRLRAVTGVH